MRAFRAAGALAVQQVRDSAVSVEGASEEETRDLLRKCAATTLNSKLVRARFLLGAQKPGSALSNVAGPRLASQSM